MAGIGVAKILEGVENVLGDSNAASAVKSVYESIIAHV
jgi:hypothetical protein